MSTPEFIYLVPGKYDGERGMIWSDDPDPDSYSDPEEAVKYVRFDSIEALQAMNADLTEEIDHLQDSLIRQGKMLSAIVNITKGQPEGSTLHSTHDAVESVERLQARSADLESSDVVMCLSELMRGLGIPAASSCNKPGFLYAVGKAIADQAKAGADAEIKRKQAEAVEEAVRVTMPTPHGDMSNSSAGFHEYCEGVASVLEHAKRLRNEAEKVVTHESRQ